MRQQSAAAHRRLHQGRAVAMPRVQARVSRLLQRRVRMSELKDAVRPVGVAIDYDDTFTTCVDTWTEVCDVLRGAGCRVMCVTFRPDTPQWHISDFPGEVFYTGGRPKA